MSVNRGMDTENVVLYTMEYYSAIKKNEFMKFLGIYSEDAPTCNKDTCSTMFIAAIFIIARSWKEPICPSTEE